MTFKPASTNLIFAQSWFSCLTWRRNVSSQRLHQCLTLSPIRVPDNSQSGQLADKRWPLHNWRIQRSRLSDVGNKRTPASEVATFIAAVKERTPESTRPPRSSWHNGWAGGTPARRVDSLPAKWARQSSATFNVRGTMALLYCRGDTVPSNWLVDKLWAAYCT